MLAVFGLDVPQRHVDGGDRRHRDRAAPPVRAAIQELPDVFDLVRIAADEAGHDVIGQIAGDGQFATVQGCIADTVERRCCVSIFRVTKLRPGQVTMTRASTMVFMGLSRNGQDHSRLTYFGSQLGEWLQRHHLCCFIVIVADPKRLKRSPQVVRGSPGRGRLQTCATQFYRCQESNMAKQTGRSVMVAVRNLDASSHTLLRKAAVLAKQRSASLHLVHAIALPRSPLSDPMASVRDAAQAEMKDRRRQLTRLARSSGLKGIRIVASAIWDYPAADALVRMVLRHRPQLLIVESQRHGRFARMVLSNTDWELIRHCPCPLWLSKTPELPARASVIAALDPYHLHAKPAALDNVILRQAMAAAGNDPDRVFACHFYSVPQPVVVDGAADSSLMGMIEELQPKLRADAQARVSKLAARHGMTQDHVVVLAGDPAWQLPRTAARLKVGVIVMGAVSRGGLRRVFIGSTAERVLDRLACDVLIVKPRGFRSSVPRQASG